MGPCYLHDAGHTIYASLMGIIPCSLLMMQHLKIMMRIHLLVGRQLSPEFIPEVDNLSLFDYASCNIPFRKCYLYRWSNDCRLIKQSYIHVRYIKYLPDFGVRWFRVVISTYPCDSFDRFTHSIASCRIFSDTHSITSTSVSTGLFLMVVMQICTFIMTINFPSGHYMMTSSNGNIFRVTCHLCWKFTGPRWNPHTKASDAELWCLLWSEPK